MLVHFYSLNSLFIFYKSINKYLFIKVSNSISLFSIAFCLIPALSYKVAKNLAFLSENLQLLSSFKNESSLSFENFLISIKEILDDTGLFSNTDEIFDDIMSRFSEISQRAVFSAAVSITSAGGVLLDIGIGFVAAFYFLCEKERLLYRLNETIEVFLPKNVFKILKSMTHDLNIIFSGYVSGQIMDALIMTFLISAAMWVLGIKYFMIIGIISGIANLIPYVGSIAAFILSVVSAAAQGTPVKALYAAVMIISLQQFDAMFIVPRVVGSRVKLHPVLVILALSIFGGMFGIIGMIFAVPVTAFIKQNFDRIYMKKKFRA